MGRRITLLVTVVGLGVALAGCPPPTGDPTGGGGGTPADPIVYVAGYRFDGTRNVATYWVDDGETIEHTELHPGVEGEATDIVVDGSGAVHAVGWYKNLTNDDVAAYWKDGVVENLVTGGRATGLALDSGGVAYVSGRYDDSGTQTAAWWTVDAGVVPVVVSGPNDLHATGNPEATGIALDGSDVYVSGVWDEGSGTVPVYWIDSAASISSEQLSTSPNSLANAIFHDGSSIYVAGRDLGAGVDPAYWLNNAAGLQTLVGTPGEARAILRGGGQTYVAGDYLNADTVRQAVRWDGTSPTDLDSSAASTPTFAYGIVYDDGVALVAGTHRPATEDEAVYWNGTTIVELDAGVASVARALTVGP